MDRTDQRIYKKKKIEKRKLEKKWRNDLVEGGEQ